MKKQILILIGVLSMLPAISFARGVEGGGGGDICQYRIEEIRNDISAWIQQGGSAKLNFQGSGTALANYNQAMQTVIALTRQNDQTSISCTDNQAAVQINGAQKTCIAETESGLPHILCYRGITRNGQFISGFMGLSQDDQYFQIHHELAVLARIEDRSQDTSDYPLSRQISAHLQNETIKKLAIQPQTLKDDSDTQSAMFKALDNNDLSALQRLLASGADPNIANDFHISILMEAAFNGRLDFVQTLVAAGANVNFKVEGLTALALAYRSSDIVHYLLAHNADPNVQVTFKNGWLATKSETVSTFEFFIENAICDSDSAAVVSDLIAHGANPRAKVYPGNYTALEEIGCNDPHSSFDPFGSNNDDPKTEIVWSADSTSVDAYIQVARALLKAGVDINSLDDNGNTALGLLAYQLNNSGLLDEGRFLIENGAKVHVVNNNGDNILMLASWNHEEYKGDSKDFELAGYLLARYKFNINAKDEHGNTALTLAAGTNSAGITQLLIKHGANVNAANDDDDTALILNAGDGPAETAQELISAGADIHHVDYNGRTALAWATMSPENTAYKSVLCRYLKTCRQ